MPSVLSLFRHGREKGRPAQGDGGGQKKNTVKKRRSRFSIAVSGNSSRVVRRSASLNSAPEPLEQVGSSKAADVPELPSFPLYQNFASMRQLGDPRRRAQLCEEKSELRGGRRLSRVATVSDLHSLRSQSELVPGNTNGDDPLSTSKPPACDRAVELARLYRSILPDFHTMGEEAGQEDEEKKEAGRENERDGRDAGGPRTALPNATVASTIRPCPDRPNTRGHSEAGDGRDDLSVLSQQSAVGLQICTDLLVGRLVGALGLQRHGRGGGGGGGGGGGHAGPGRGRGRVEDGSGSSAGVKEKAKAKAKEEREDEGGSCKQLEMLLLIEAYEGLLRCCRRETGAAAAAGGNGVALPLPRADGQGRGRLADAVPILEHWLETLHALYEATFEEDGEA
ncbi:hypothetical protein VTH06DRAFT_125 [Thermothelomyces fergusii]